MSRFEFRQSSRLQSPAVDVWAVVSRMRGVNAELQPLARMTAPVDWQDKALDTAPPGQVLFKSWILLFGFIPFDLHALKLVEVDPGVGFHEHSSSVWQRHWIHRRSLKTNDDGCEVVDDVAFQLRLPLVGEVLLPVFQQVFKHRHRRLRRQFNHD